MSMLPSSSRISRANTTSSVGMERLEVDPDGQVVAACACRAAVVTRVDAVHGAEPDRPLRVGQRARCRRQSGVAGTATRVGSTIDMPAPSAMRPLAEDARRLAGLALGHQLAVAEHDARSQMERTWSGECVTKRMVRPSFWNWLDPVDALALEALVAHRQDLVDHQDVGVDVDGHGEAQPHVHARRVELDRAVDELLELGEVDDGVEDPVDLPLGHAEQRAVQVDVLPAGEVLLEPGAQLQQAGQLARAPRPRPWWAGARRRCT